MRPGEIGRYGQWCCDDCVNGRTRAALEMHVLAVGKSSLRTKEVIGGWTVTGLAAASCETIAEMRETMRMAEMRDMMLKALVVGRIDVRVKDECRSECLEWGKLVCARVFYTCPR